MPGELSQTSDDLDKAVFDTAVGSNSDVVPVQGTGTFLLRILAEETKTPTADQVKIIKDNGFNYWYAQKKSAADINYNIGSTVG